MGFEETNLACLEIEANRNGIKIWGLDEMRKSIYLWRKIKSVCFRDSKDLEDWTISENLGFLDIVV